MTRSPSSAAFLPATTTMSGPTSRPASATAAARWSYRRTPTSTRLRTDAWHRHPAGPAPARRRSRPHCLSVFRNGKEMSQIVEVLILATFYDEESDDGKIRRPFTIDRESVVK